MFYVVVTLLPVIVKISFSNLYTLRPTIFNGFFTFSRILLRYMKYSGVCYNERC